MEHGYCFKLTFLHLMHLSPLQITFQQLICFIAKTRCQRCEGVRDCALPNLTHSHPGVFLEPQVFHQSFATFLLWRELITEFWRGANRVGVVDLFYATRYDL